MFVGRKVLDVWAESDEHHGGQSRFRDQHSARGKLNLAALRRIVSGKIPVRRRVQPTPLCRGVILGFHGSGKDLSLIELVREPLPPPINGK